MLNLEVVSGVIIISRFLSIQIRDNVDIFSSAGRYMVDFLFYFIFFFGTKGGSDDAPDEQICFELP
jgi:hypothetical protein